jgi:hypothetical protein
LLVAQLKKAKAGESIEEIMKLPNMRAEGIFSDQDLSIKDMDLRSAIRDLSDNINKLKI